MIEDITQSLLHLLDVLILCELHESLTLPPASLNLFSDLLFSESEELRASSFGQHVEKPDVPLIRGIGLAKLLFKGLWSDAMLKFESIEIEVDPL